MKYLGWIVLLLFIVAGVVWFKVKHEPLQGKLQQQVKETEMWIGKTEQMKRRLDLGETRQSMAPDASLLLADMFTHTDSFVLTKFARDTLSALANEMRMIKGEISVSIFSDDSATSLYTKVKYPDAFSYAAAKGTAIVRYLRTQGIPAERLVLLAYGTGRERGASLPDLRHIARRRVEIRVQTTE